MDYISLTMSSICFCFIIFLIFIYFSKNKNNKTESIFYKIIILFNLLLTLTEFIYPFLCFYAPDNLLLIGLIKKTTYFCLITCLISLMGYVVYKTFDKNKNSFIRNNILMIITILIVACAAFEFIIPIGFAYRSSGMVWYSYGPAVNSFPIICFVVSLIVMISFILSNWKKLNKDNIFPYIIILLIQVISFTVNIFYPWICLVSFSTTLISYLLYHTVENPDKNKVYEYAKEKKLAQISNNDKIDFLNSMSSELKIPLNSIIKSCEKIKNKKHNEDIKDEIEILLKSSKYLLNLAKNFSLENQLEANLIELNSENYKPKELFNELIKSTHKLIGDKPIKLRTYISKQLPNLLAGDKEKLTVIINNLISNAVKYTNNGFIDLKVDSECKNDNCNLQITVTDTGRGIKQEDMDKLFTKFHKMEEDKDSGVLGTGLGLSITKSLVNLFGGGIVAFSTYGVGTTFIVNITQKIGKEIVEEKKEDDDPNFDSELL